MSLKRWLILLGLLPLLAGIATAETKFRGSYFKNGEIHVNTYGTPEDTPK